MKSNTYIFKVYTLLKRNSLKFFTNITGLYFFIIYIKNIYFLGYLEQGNLDLS